MTYDPQNYWHTRGHAYQGQEHWEEMVCLKEMVHKHITTPSKVLEVGSGYGRIYQLLKSELVDFHACDIADSMRYVHCERTGLLPDKWDGERLPYDADAFKLVIAFDVLLHIPPKDIRRILGEMCRASSRLVCVASWVVPVGTSLATHVFSHDYDRLFVEQGLSVISEESFGERKLWMLHV